ncbi:hypothetical protein F7725_018168, partial [Dissostichus mawsoni]
MATALTVLLTVSLLQGALCVKFKVIMPQTIDALSGSCVTIPCSFDVPNIHEPKLDSTCRAVWKNLQGTVVFNSRDPQQTTIKGTLIGDLTKKDCTTTLNNMQTAHSNTYAFRLECNNGLKYIFLKSTVNISVKASCRSHLPTLTWTPGLGLSQETLQENKDKIEVKTSVMSFTASHQHQGKTISCTATYNKQEGSAESAVSTRLTANISCRLTCPLPKLIITNILPSSDCTKAEAQLNCSCKTAGNPSPTLQWYLDGSPVNHSDMFSISYEPLNDTGLRSTIAVSRHEERDLSTLLCRSYNSLGSASQLFCVNSLGPETSANNQDRVMFPVFITTVFTLLVLVCALLFVIRIRRTQHNLQEGQRTGDTSRVMSQLLTSGEGNEIPNTTEEDIYVNSEALRQADVAHPTIISEPNRTNLQGMRPNNAEGARKSSEKEKGNTDIYS